MHLREVDARNRLRLEPGVEGPGRLLLLAGSSIIMIIIMITM